MGEATSLWAEAELETMKPLAEGGAYLKPHYGDVPQRRLVIASKAAGRQDSGAACVC